MCGCSCTKIKTSHAPFPRPFLAIYRPLLLVISEQVCELHFETFSLYFLQSLPSEEIAGLPAPDSPEAYSRMGCSWEPVLELTHNHGTESDPTFSYHNGNADPKVGFGRF